MWICLLHYFMGTVHVQMSSYNWACLRDLSSQLAFAWDRNNPSHHTCFELFVIRSGPVSTPIVRAVGIWGEGILDSHRCQRKTVSRDSDLVNCQFSSGNEAVMVDWVIFWSLWMLYHVNNTLLSLCACSCVYTYILTYVCVFVCIVPHTLFFLASRWHRC